MLSATTFIDLLQLKEMAREHSRRHKLNFASQLPDDFEVCCHIFDHLNKQDFHYFGFMVIYLYNIGN
jgi:hypothetical protein